MAKQTRLSVDVDAVPYSPPTQGSKPPLDLCRTKLRERLQDEKLRSIAGFPEGADDNIVLLSTPPNFTACPNPFVSDWLSSISSSSPSDDDLYVREPFAADVSEGRNDEIYNIHSYHTKVPHKAIMRYVLHYTDPGDIIFDGFCGSGMAGFAALACGDDKFLSELGFKIRPDGELIGANGQPVGMKGVRSALLCDLSPAAAFMSSNYCHLDDLGQFLVEANTVIDSLERKLDWLYDHEEGKIASTLWSDVFHCPACSTEIVYWDHANRDLKTERSFPCPKCRTSVGKSASKKTKTEKLERSLSQVYDPYIGNVVAVPKMVMVQQVVCHGRRRQTINVDGNDLISIQRMLENAPSVKVPVARFPTGRQTNKLINGSSISYVHHMYMPRALYAYASLWAQELSQLRFSQLFKFTLLAVNNYICRKQGYFGGGGGVSGTLFTPSIHIERNVFDVLRRKLKSLSKVKVLVGGNSCVTTQSATDLSNIPDNCIDYIFTDPPFGESLQYAELNFMAEAWLGVRTHLPSDCVLNYVHEKGLSFYGKTMAGALKEYARILKPGRWMTIEFHNSQSAVWAAIQDALSAAGMMIAEVRVLDKQQKSFNAVNRAGAVDQDLVISAFKPRRQFTERFRELNGQPQSVLEFLREYLSILPPVETTADGYIVTIPERTRFLLFDRMVAYYLKQGVRIPLSASEFYQLLEDEFIERDGMYFLLDQIGRYDTQRARSDVKQLNIFVQDEKTAIQWLRNQLLEHPKTVGELVPVFMQETKNWDESEERFELRDLLRENFISDSSGTWRVPDLDNERDLEAQRRKYLLRTFETYFRSKGKLKVYRKEAILEGYRYCWSTKQYAAIVLVSDKLPSDALQDNLEFLQFYQIAKELVSTMPQQLDFSWEG